jgi:hypothetical protein
MAKTARKTAGRPFTKGADPRRGHGKKGRSGRKPVAFVQECSDLADTEILPKLAEKLASGHVDDPAWQWAAMRVLEYSKSKAATTTKVDVPAGTLLPCVLMPPIAEPS